MQKIRGHLREIGRQLWDRGGSPGSGRAAVMIGAGFSRNAMPRASIAAKFPGWEDLSRALVEKLYPACDGCNCASELPPKPTCGQAKLRRRRIEGARETSGSLRLAEMYEAVHGRAALEGVIGGAIPNGQYQPHTVHQKLVRLPWADIFTTNWDRMLEDAIDLYDRSYAIVNSVRQIPIARSPRIVKLHGTLDAGSRLISTESDYLNYPREFAPFVSLVQQSMMENVFVLIGFSGEDPNFLQWLGWVRAQLGEYIQQVYLVDFSDPDEAERRLLSRRGVIPLNIRELLDDDGPGTDHAAALMKFFEALDNAKYETRANLNWPKGKRGKWVMSSEFDQSPSDVQRVWKGRLKEAPQWLVLPASNRDLLHGYLGVNAAGSETNGEFNKLIELVSGDGSGTSPPSLVERLEAAGTLLELHSLGATEPGDQLLEALARLLAMLYERNSGSAETAANGGDRKSPEPPPADLAVPDVGDGEAFTRMWCREGSSKRLAEEIRALGGPARDGAMAALVATLRDARRKLERKLFDWVTETLEAVGGEADSVLQARIERVVWHLAALEPVEAKAAWERLLVKWSEPAWALRKSALAIELEEIVPACRLLEESMEQIRKIRSDTETAVAAIWRDSREGWIYYAYRSLLRQHGASIPSGSRRERDLSNEEVIDGLDDRLSEGAAGRADPRVEIAACEARLVEAAYSLRLAGEQPSRRVIEAGRAAASEFLGVARQAGMAATAVRHERFLPFAPPLAMTAAALLWTSNFERALGILFRSAVASDLAAGPIPITGLIEAMSAEQVDEFLLILGEKALGLVSVVGRPEVRPSYLWKRLDLVLGLLSALAQHPKHLSLGVLDVACKLHDRPEFGKLKEIYIALGRVFEIVLVHTQPDEWGQVLVRLFELSVPLRSGECWGDLRWPDPFRLLIRRQDGGSPDAEIGFGLTELGRRAAAAPKSGALDFARSHARFTPLAALQGLSSAETRPVRRRLAFLAEIGYPGDP
jgi:hypothetical protein